MPISKLKFIKYCAEFRKKDVIKLIPPNTRGIYALLKQHGKKKYDVVYIGMSGAAKAGIRGRLLSHEKKKKGLWSHFSVFEVWDNITEEEVRELEGLLRHIYRKDTRANKIARQKAFGKLKSRKVRIRDLKKWPREAY
ncbi:MAG: hypothetical protein WA405_01750 [Candidatus Acidiferrales bacterium]